jgi:uncharacterized protein YggE
MRRLLIPLIVVLIAGTAQAQQYANAPLTFRVAGEAQVLPDKALLHFCIIGEGETLAKAQAQQKEIEQDIVKALAENKIKSDSMQTESFSITPLNVNTGGSSIPSVALKPLGYRVQRGYSVQIPVTPNTLDNVIGMAGVILEHGARPSATPDSSSYGYSSYSSKTPALIDFMVPDTEKLTQLAIDDALNQAKKLAEQTASRMSTKPKVRLVQFKMLDSRYFPDRRNFGDPSNTSPTVWQAVRATVNVEASFFCD